MQPADVPARLIERARYQGALGAHRGAPVHEALVALRERARYRLRLAPQHNREERRL